MQWTGEQPGELSNGRPGRSRVTAAVGAALAVMLPLGPLKGELRVTQVEAVRAAVKKPTPEYNGVAKQMRVQGDVEVEVAITEKGDVHEVKVLTGNALLTPIVVKTIKDWKFTPFLEGGKPTPAITQLRFTFKL